MSQQLARLDAVIGAVGDQPNIDAPGAQLGDDDSQRALRTLMILAMVGIASIAVYAAQLGTITQAATTASVGILVAGACVVVGGLLGFLFGIPRTLQQERAGSAEPATRRVEYLANTNLEQISDWLTKILVGVGLTQIKSIPDRLQALANYLAPGMGNSASSAQFAMALLLYFLVCGFLLGYLWTRLFLPGAFRRADLAAVGAAITATVTARVDAQVINEVSKQVKNQAQLDAEALNLAYSQLNPPPGALSVTQAQLDQVIAAASPAVKIQVFAQAEGQRRNNWRSPETKPTMERTIPIFRALAADDTRGRFHRNHGQLGFALKDQTQPAWDAAVAELTTAIEIRDRQGEGGWLFYEFNRAFCWIMLDGAYSHGQASSAEVKRKVMADLRAAARNSFVRRLIMDDAVCGRWLTLSGLTAADLD